jgi:hypothetical protein
MFYTTHTHEDKQNTFLNVDSQFDVLKDSFLIAKFYYKDMREDRGTPDSQSRFLAANPLENETAGGIIGYEHKLNRFQLNVSHDVQHVNYIDGLDGVGLPLVNPNHERSRFVNVTEVRLGYDLSSGYQAYLKGGYDQIDYDNVFASQDNLDRSSNGYTLLGGLKLDLGRKLTADAYMGYRLQDYQSVKLKTIQGLTGGLLFQWMPNGLTTIKLGLDRQINETSQVQLSGFFATAVTASIDHELRRNIILNIHSGYSNNDYVGTLAVNRQEDNYNIGFNMKYFLNRYVYCKASYDYDGRSVNSYTDSGAGSDYDINSVFLTLGGQL